MGFHKLRSNYGIHMSGRYLARWLLTATAIFLLFIIILRLFPSKTELSMEFRHLQALQEKADKSTTCKVPTLNPWDPTILKYYEKQEELKCQRVQEQIASLQDGKVVFNLTLAAQLQCWISVFQHGESDFDPVYGRRIETNFTITNVYPVEEEFMEVNCERSGLIGLAQTAFRFHFHNLKPKTENILKKPILPSSPEHPSVVMLGLDSMSYGNVVRQLPNTYKTMQKMGFQDMKGHVKIGDNTFANWMAILTGKRATTTNEFDAELDENWDIFFDDWDFVWKNFSKNGYTTLFAEDRPDIGTFNYFGYLCGFKKPPVDHYFRPYWLMAFWSIVARRSSPYCYDTQPRHNIQLAYLDKFVNKYQGKRHFAFWWTQDMSHDYLNVIGKTDLDIERFLVKNSKVMEDSIVIVFSDHGHRYDRIRETVVGRLEARLPFLSIRIPDNIREKYPHLAKNLKENSQKMTTQFDMNESLNRIAWGTFMQESVAKPNHRAYSIFHPTPEIRTCYQAGIPEDYCPCFTEVEIPVVEAVKPAEVLLNYVNELLLNFDTETAEAIARDNADGKEKKTTRWSCQQLHLKSITYASIRLPPNKVIDDPQTGGIAPVDGIEIQYRIVFEADPPSNAIIEGVVLKNFNSDIWQSTGELERNNKYGNTSHCVVDRMLKKICHCIELPII